MMYLYSFPIPILESDINFSRQWLRIFFFYSTIQKRDSSAGTGWGRLVFGIIHDVYVHRCCLISFLS